MSFHRWMDVTLPVRRETPRLAMWATASALLVLVGMAPLGIPRLEGALSLTAVVAPGPHLAPGAHVDLLAVVLGRLALLIPFGDLPFRLAALSGILSALGLGFWVRAGLEVMCMLRPPPHARLTAADVAHEPVAVMGAAAVVAITQPFFVHATDAGLGGTELFLLAAWTCVLTFLLRDRNDARAALGAAFLAGVAVASSGFLAALLLPCGVAFWVWGVSVRARWVVWAPVLFFTGALLLVPAAVLSAGQAATAAGWWHSFSLGVLRQSATGVAGAAWWQAAMHLAESLGVVAGVLCLIGCGVLAWRAPAVAAVVLFALWAAVIMKAASPGSEKPLALWLGMAVLPLSAGISHFAAKLGRARVATAWTLVVMSAVAPALAGGVARWHPDGRLPLRMLMRAYDGLPPRSDVDPGSAQMRRLFQYGATVGLRPDIRFDSVAPSRPSPDRRQVE